MSIQAIVANELVEDASSLWVLKGHGRFAYSDGAEAEKYLSKVLGSAKDLSSRSRELEAHIKDWPSEYHLTSKRSQLLSGFAFDPTLKVLEVGCGCGAITRFLGETFQQVVSIEGSQPRARIARQRTRDLPGVSIVCAPFQELNFKQKFDIIFCIGVYEYSASFVQGDDPYDEVLKYFSDLLTPDGIVVIAIENQFGLKYFTAAREDHVGVMFEGIEGYHSHLGRVRTFGKTELKTKLKKHFPVLDFYYPFPDYKLPDCVLSQEFLSSGHAGELVSQMRSRAYAGGVAPMWDESSTLLELSRNNALDFFASSFLVIAGRSTLNHVRFDQQGIVYSSKRKSTFSTQTRILKGQHGELVVSKRTAEKEGRVTRGPVTLVNTTTPWIDAQSLHTIVRLRCKSRSSSVSEIFKPCKAWVEFLVANSTTENGVRYVPGEHVDSIWPNVYLINGQCRVVDKEWIWSGKIPTNVMVIRAIFDFLSKVEGMSNAAKALSHRSGRTLISQIASAIGVTLSRRDFDDFVLFECEFQHFVFDEESNTDALRTRRLYLKWFLINRWSFELSRRAARVIRNLVSAARNLIARFI